MIYLDNHATTPVDPQVCDAVDNAMRTMWANPHSVTHQLGWDANDAVESARGVVARSVGARNTEVIFTSGATESNNIIVKGIALGHSLVADGTASRRKILVSSIEHPCLLESAKYMQQCGVEVGFIPVLKTGRVDIEALEKMLDNSVALVSVMMVNNELGTIQDIQKISEMTHSVGAVMHSDVAQALGKVPVNMKTLGLDAISISGHKIYGPKGVGALVIRRGVDVAPLFSGGGQEKGLRSGTLSPPLCIGLAKACALAVDTFSTEHERIMTLRNTLEKTLLNSLDSVEVLGDIHNRVAGNLSVLVRGIDGEDFFSKLKNTAISTGSACSSSKQGGSHVLSAIGMSESVNGVVLRICIGRFNTQSDIDLAGAEITQVIKSL